MNKKIGFDTEIIAGLTDNVETPRNPENLVLVWSVILKNKTALFKLRQKYLLKMEKTEFMPIYPKE